METLDLLKEREAQALALTDEQREEDNPSNPIAYAEQGPNRFNVMSLFFTDDDGVRISEDLELNEVSVYYFHKMEEIQITDGAVYDWAINFYKDNF